MECSVSQWTSSPRRHQADTVRRNMWTARRMGTGRKTCSLFINIIIIHSFLGHWLSFLWVHISPQFYINRVLFCEHSETHLVTLMISFIVVGFTEHSGHFREKVNWIEINCSYKETWWRVLLRIRDSNPEMQIVIWFTNVKEGVMHRNISSKILFESTASVGHLSNLEMNNTKTTLSPLSRICNSN